jgi:acetyltransferase-like isoleucine patch superfamily enzyme
VRKNKLYASIEKIGINSYIHPSVEFKDLNSITIGDNVEIHENVSFFGAGNVFIDDYSKIYRNCSFISRGEITLGQVSWIGERTVIDGTGKFQAGNFLGVGIGSSLYSHIQHADVTEGSLYDKKSELIIGDDVWFVGQCLVSPVNVGNKSMAMLGSVIIKDMKPEHLYGGNPAIDITEKTGPAWRTVSLEEKFDRVSELVRIGCKEKKLDYNQFEVVYEMPNEIDCGITYYNVSTREYTKRNNKNEIALNKWLFSSKAKFKRYDED